MNEILHALGTGNLLEIGKVGLLFAIARFLYLLHKDTSMILSEHRILMDDLWKRHPEKKDDFYLAIDGQKRKNLFKRAAAGR